MREALENHPTENYLTGATQVPKTCAKDESGGAGRGRGKIGKLGNWKLEIGNWDIEILEQKELGSPSKPFNHSTTN